MLPNPSPPGSKQRNIINTEPAFFTFHFNSRDSPFNSIRLRFPPVFTPPVFSLTTQIQNICTMTLSRPADVFGGQDNLKAIDSDKSQSSTPKSDSPEAEAVADPVLKDAPVGSISDIKSLYQGTEDSQGRAQWVDRYPEDAEEAAENGETEKYALIARKKKCFNGRKKFDIHSIVVHSPDLKEVLGRVFRDYPGVSCELHRLVFAAPFEEFVHRWTEFTTELNLAKPGKTKEHLELLYSILKEELKDTIKALEDYVVHGIITYQHLWVIFQPGAIIYTRQSGTPQAMSFHHGAYTKTDCGPCYRLSVEAIGWGGSNFGRSTDYINIYSWTGTRPIKDLHSLPLSLHPEKETVKSSLVDRGRKYESLSGYHFKS